MAKDNGQEPEVEQPISEPEAMANDANLQAAYALIASRKMPMSLSMPGKLWLAVQAEAKDKNWASAQEMCMVIIAERIGMGDDPCMAEAKGKRKYASEEERKAVEKARRDEEARIKKAAVEAFQASQKSEQANALRGWLNAKDVDTDTVEGEAVTGGVTVA